MTSFTPILLLPARGDDERDRVAAAWKARGWEVLRLDRFWEPPPIEPNRVKIYGGTAFAYVVAQKLGLDLVSPPDDLIITVGVEWTRRHIGHLDLVDADAGPFPRFVKPLVPKLFTAGVFPDAPTLAAETKGLEADTGVLVSEVVEFEAEARVLVADHKAISAAVYDGQGAASEAMFFVEGLRSCALPDPLVIDVGLIRGRGWAVIEFNPSWGAGLNGCDPDAMVQCLVRATRPSAPTPPPPPPTTSSA